jgi:hypothetical protein
VLAPGLRDSTGNSIRHQVSVGYVITSRFDVLLPELEQALSAKAIASAGVLAGARVRR